MANTGSTTETKNTLWIKSSPETLYQAFTEPLGGDRSAPLERATQVKQPALVMDGGANFQMMPFMHDTAAALAKAIPHAQQKTLEGQTHDVNPEVIAPGLIAFFGGG